MKIELRSDTFSLPSKEMRNAMFTAEIGDDVFGEDQSVNELERLSADMFGMEASLFCPSGTMTNQIAINVHTQSGDEVICDEESHIYYYEGGGIGRNSGCQPRLIHGDRGRITADQVAEAINPNDVHRARTSLVSLENTCNRGGGSCYEIEEMQKIRKLCDEHSLRLHLDGARLMNAIVAKQHNPIFYGKNFHSISLCLSKGLGAPVGSVLMGSDDFIKQARRVRKVMGGGMRQAGFLAAAGIYALKHNIGRLQKDHDRAKLLEIAIAPLPWVKHILPVETNIVIFEVAAEYSARDILNKLSDKNIFAASMSATHIRMVTHLNLTDEMINDVIETLKSLPIQPG